MENKYSDQIPTGGVCEQPVKVEWIVGKVTGLEDMSNEGYEKDSTKNDNIPGFEVVAFFAAALAVVWARKRKRRQSQ
ncbi:MAG: hypothetical protein J7L58_06080 [Thermoplasmata archaeon]|nr:hypothetical protein [Thermoplasmata archaeon]